MLNDNPFSSCLVTGAAGFIGIPLCIYLREHGMRVRALLRRKSDGPWDESGLCELGRDTLPGDLLRGIDCVFHLAGAVHAVDESSGDDRWFRTVNVEGTRSLLDAAISNQVKCFVYFSSVKAMGDPHEHCIDETWQALPDSPYGRSKKEAETQVLDAGRRSGMHVCVLRPALVYGPQVKGNLYRMIEAIRTHRFPPLPDTGNRRSMVSVDDLVDAAWRAANNPVANGQTYIVSDDQPYSTRQLYEWICLGLGRDIPRWTLPVWPLHLAAHAGDALQRFTHRAMPFNSHVFQRLTGSACYVADKLRNDLDWRSGSNLQSILPRLVKQCGHM